MLKTEQMGFVAVDEKFFGEMIDQLDNYASLLKGLGLKVQVDFIDDIIDKARYIEQYYATVGRKKWL
jgi:hypothetical protein